MVITETHIAHIDFRESGSVINYYFATTKYL